jgi:hypothetical protein
MGANVGANVHRRQAVSGNFQRTFLQFSGTSDDLGLRVAAERN